MSRQSILITGSNGFIGKNLVPFLADKYEVFGINKTFDKKIPHYHPKKKNLQKFLASDIPKNCSTIIHMAASTDVMWCQKHPKQCYDVNVGITQKLLDAARAKNCKFVYMSTAHVYGNPQSNPVSENHVTHPNSIYAASKLSGEIICEAYAKSYGLEIAIPRLFSVYGPHSSSHLVISRILSQLNKNTISLGNIKSKRDFVYVYDVVLAIDAILKKSSGFCVYNVGTGIDTTIEQVFKTIKRLTGKNLKIKQQKNLIRKNDVMSLIADNHSLRKLGWTPKFSLEDGLKEILDLHTN